ncbi:hypothetical protein Adu01nite_14910 [Paractinoplanes durhamensis]|uniref:EamA domain-containing protein n=1 Tax=Paractinoplanes durhamensis TaxID=113563 RepID=A0ABQ3YRH1_9ACTN|nr:hypothetical protein [Actinoplanes durhamensis]GIE00141.1 hypothetical protein Adu01nite_14910 [Actinoplanes durhamensis]
MSLAIAVLAAIAYAGGSILQAMAATRPGTVLALAVSPLYLAGLAADAGAWVLSLWALQGLAVYVVQAVLAGSLALTVLLAPLVLHAVIRPRDYLAIVVMVSALAVVGMSSREQPAPPAGGGAVTLLSVAGFAVAALAGLAVLMPGRTDRRGLLLAGLAGLAYSATALAGRMVQQRTPLIATLAEPLLWVVISAGVAGTAAYAVALKRGAVAPTTALLWGVEVIVPAVVAIPLLGDEIRPGWRMPAALAIAAVVGAAAILAGSPGTEQPS